MEQRVGWQSVANCPCNALGTRRVSVAADKALVFTDRERRAIISQRLLARARCLLELSGGFRRSCFFIHAGT